MICNLLIDSYIPLRISDQNFTLIQKLPPKFLHFPVVLLTLSELTTYQVIIMNHEALHYVVV